MHELSIALGIVDGVTEEAQNRGFQRISAVHLRLGTLSGVVADALQFAWGEACHGTMLEQSVLEIEEVPLVARCPACSEEREIPDIYSFFCPVCTTPVDVVSGRELEITAMEVEG